MRREYLPFLLVIAATLPATGTTLASVNLNPATDCAPQMGSLVCSVEADFTRTYWFQVVGGTGDGLAIISNELTFTLFDGPPFPQFFAGGAMAENSGPQFEADGFFTGTTHGECPLWGGPGCQVAFTYGDLETLTLTGYARATFLGPLGTPASDLTGIVAEVQFNGLQGLRDSEGGVLAGQVVVFDSPEPSSFWMLLLIAGVPVLTRIRGVFHLDLGKSSPIQVTRFGVWPTLILR